MYCEKFSSAEVFVVEGEKKKITLTAFDDVIIELLGNDTTPLTEEALLRCPQISEIHYQNNEIIKVVHQAEWIPK